MTLRNRFNQARQPLACGQKTYEYSVKNSYLQFARLKSVNSKEHQDNLRRKKATFRPLKKPVKGLSHTRL
jgi:hypothetical protein